MKTIIHVNQHKIKANKKASADSLQPVLTVKTYKDNRYGFTARIVDEKGKEVAKVVYRPEKPLSCGAHCWVETQLKVEVL